MLFRSLLPMKAVLVASEAVPYSKTGGLADVSGALPKALKRIGVDVRVILPRYTGISFRSGDVVSQANGYQIFDDLAVPFAGGVKYASVYEDWLDDTPFYFIDSPEYSRAATFTAPAMRKSNGLASLVAPRWN